MSSEQTATGSTTYTTSAEDWALCKTTSDGLRGNCWSANARCCLGSGPDG